MHLAARTMGGSSSLATGATPAAPEVTAASFPAWDAASPPAFIAATWPAAGGSLNNRRRGPVAAPGAGVLKNAPGIWRIGVTGFISLARLRLAAGIKSSGSKETGSEKNARAAGSSSPL